MKKTCIFLTMNAYAYTCAFAAIPTDYHMKFSSLAVLCRFRFLNQSHNSNFNFMALNLYLRFYKWNNEKKFQALFEFGILSTWEEKDLKIKIFHAFSRSKNVEWIGPKTVIIVWKFLRFQCICIFTTN